MKQVQSFNPSDMAQTAVKNFAGRQKGTEQTGILNEGKGFQNPSSFKGLLQGKQQIFGMTKEQEQTAALAASGLAEISGFMFSQVSNAAMQAEEKGLYAMQSVLPEVSEAMTAVNMYGIEMPKNFTGEAGDMEDVPEMALETEQTSVPLQAVTAETAETAHENSHGAFEQQETSDTFFEMTKDVSGEPKDVTESVQTLNWQETMLKQQDILAQPSVKTVSQETVKVDIPQEIPQCIAQRTVEKVSAGIQEFEIQIEPENLGKIAVKVEYGEGQATISLVCSETKTLELLKAHADDLGAVMEKNLRQETIVYVDEKRAETFGQQPGDDSGSARRESEWERHREERRRRMGSGNRFLQELRLGLLE